MDSFREKYSHLTGSSEERFESRLITPLSMIVVGCSSCGKTQFVLELLQGQADMLDKPFDKIVWVSRFHQDVLRQQLIGLNVQFVLNEIPSQKALMKLKAKNSLIVIDDLMTQAVRSGAVQELFTSGRHANLSVIYLTQNMFKQGPSSRDIRLNSNYTILFKNRHDCRQIRIIGEQIYLKKWPAFVACYQDATNKPFGYLLLDNRPTTHSSLRLRGKITKDYQILYRLD